jgi:hypothetical protein
MQNFDKILYSPSRSDILTNKYFEGYGCDILFDHLKFGNSPQRHSAAWPEAEIFTMSKHHSYHKRSKDSGRGAKGSRLNLHYVTHGFYFPFKITVNVQTFLECLAY